MLFLYFLFSIKNVSCEFNTSILHDAVSVISLKSARPNIFADLQVKAVLCQRGEEHLHSVAWGNFSVNHVESLLDAAFLTGLYFSCFLIFYLLSLAYKMLGADFTVLSLFLFSQSCPTLCDCSPPSSPAHEISQARMLEWVSLSFSRGSSQFRMEPKSPAWHEDSLPLNHLGHSRSTVHCH